MKVKGILIFIVFCLSSICAYPQWHQVNSGTTEDIEDMVFTDSLRGYAISKKGTIINTTDGGETWTFFHEDTLLYSQVCIVATNDSVFCFGKDFWGGDYKLSFRQGDSNFSIQPISFINNSMRDPVFWSGKIYYIDGGGLFTYDNYAINCILLGVEDFTIQDNYISAEDSRYIHYSDNYGQNWTTKQFTTNLLSSGPYQSLYNGSDTLFATTHYPTIFHKSYDKGQNWISHNGSYYIRCYFTKSAIYGLTLLPTSKNIIYSSIDFGQTFQTDTLADPIGYLYFLSPSVGFAFGENGIIYKTTNGRGATGIGETSKKKLKVFPNPAKDDIEIEAAEDVIIQSIRLSDVHGKPVKEWKGNLRHLKIESISTGNYLLEIQTNKDVVTEKIMIQ
jgi:photosystem II stability/assembly factor-like uncharacterized protein